MAASIFNPFRDNFGTDMECIDLSRAVLEKIQKAAFSIKEEVFSAANQGSVHCAADTPLGNAIKSADDDVTESIGELSKLLAKLDDVNTFLIEDTSDRGPRAPFVSDSVIPLCSLLITSFEMLLSSLQEAIRMLEDSGIKSPCIENSIAGLKIAGDKVCSICALLEDISENSQIHDAFFETPLHETGHPELNRFLG